MISWCCQYETIYYDGAYHCLSCGAKKVMAQIWKPLDISVYKAWVETIVTEASDDLNSWETSFIESISTRLNSGRNLTELQAEKLESIYAEKTK